MLELSLSSRGGAVGDGPLNEGHPHFMRRERAQVKGILRRTSKLLTLRTPLEAPVTTLTACPWAAERRYDRSGP